MDKSRRSSSSTSAAATSSSGLTAQDLEAKRKGRRNESMRRSVEELEAKRQGRSGSSSTPVVGARHVGGTIHTAEQEIRQKPGVTVGALSVGVEEGTGTIHDREQQILQKGQAAGVAVGAMHVAVEAPSTLRDTELRIRQKGLSSSAGVGATHVSDIRNAELEIRQKEGQQPPGVHTSIDRSGSSSDDSSTRRHARSATRRSVQELEARKMGQPRISVAPEPPVSRKTHTIEQAVQDLQAKGLHPQAQDDLEANHSFDITTSRVERCAGGGGSSTKLDLSKSDLLVTAAEVYEDSPEEQQRKEARMEEAIKQRLIRSAVEADVVQVVSFKDEDSAETNKASSRKRHPLAIAAAVLSLALLIVGVVALLVALSQKQQDQDDTPSTVPEAPTLNLPPPDTVIAQVPTTLCYERIPLFGRSELCSEDQELGSAVTNMMAASRLWNFPRVDLSIVNAGEVKGDVAPGDFTVQNATDLLPYPNTLVILQIPGKQLVVAIERALQKLVDDYSLLEANETMGGGSYPYGAGIRYHVNMSQSFPHRLSRIEVNPQLAFGYWVPIDLAQNYSVVTNSFLASGGDGYNEFHRLPAESVHDTEIHPLSAFYEYCQDAQVLEHPPMEHFSTQAYTNLHYNWSCACYEEDMGNND